MGDTLKPYPGCFGNLDKVFPMGEDGLRATPESCLSDCSVKTLCLRQAMEGPQGIPVKEELLIRQEQTGLAGFFQRWSRKKQIHRQKYSRKRQY